MEKDFRVKRDMFIRLRNIGLYKYNLEVIREKKGEIMVVYRLLEIIYWFEYSFCLFCYGYYVVNVLWKYVKRCNFVLELWKYGKILENSRIFLFCGENSVSDGLRKIFLIMKDDVVLFVVKNDILIR